MYSKITKIRNISGLHARPAAEFVSCAKGFTSKVKLRSIADDEIANAKSIVMILALGLGAGSDVEIIADGTDEVSAVDTLTSLIVSGFGEELSI